MFNAVKKQFGLHSYLLSLALPKLPPPPIPVPALMPRLPPPPSPESLQPTTPTTPNIPGNPGSTTILNTLRMEEKDIQQTARFTREFVVMSLVPWMEKCVVEWNESVRFPSSVFRPPANVTVLFFQFSSLRLDGFHPVCSRRRVDSLAPHLRLLHLIKYRRLLLSPLFLVDPPHCPQTAFPHPLLNNEGSLNLGPFWVTINWPLLCGRHCAKKARAALCVYSCHIITAISHRYFSGHPSDATFAVAYRSSPCPGSFDHYPSKYGRFTAACTNPRLDVCCSLGSGNFDPRFY